MMSTPDIPRIRAMNSKSEIILWFLNATIIARRGGYPSPTAKTGPTGPHDIAFIKAASPMALIMLPIRPIQNCDWFSPFVIQYGMATIKIIKFINPRLEKLRSIGSKPILSVVRCFVHTEWTEIATAEPIVNNIGTQDETSAFCYIYIGFIAFGIWLIETKMTQATIRNNPIKWKYFNFYLKIIKSKNAPMKILARQHTVTRPRLIPPSQQNKHSTRCINELPLKNYNRRRTQSDSFYSPHHLLSSFNFFKYSFLFVISITS